MKRINANRGRSLPNDIPRTTMAQEASVGDPV